MLYLNRTIKNYADFKEKFGNKETRNNKIALAYLVGSVRLARKDREMEYIGKYPFTNQEVYYAMKGRMHRLGFGRSLKFLEIQLPPTSRTIDNLRGITEDGDTQVRYILNDDYEHPKKMKIGKFMRNVIQESGVFSHLSESCINYFCESATTEWESKHPAMHNYELRVDDDFEEIYSSRNMAGDFGSCMTNDDQWYFYKEAVSAKAASIWRDGKMYARCVIFTEVHDDDTGEVLRLAERQYAVDKDPVLKQILIRKLIEANEIDGYKETNACYNDVDKFVLNDGTTMYGRKFSIGCNLEYDDIISYQDSFKWYDYNNQVSYNYEALGYTDDLGTCDRYFGGDEIMVDYYHWDNYNDRYVSSEADEDWVSSNCVEIGGCYYDDWYTDHNGNHIRCDEAVYSNREDEYYHEDDAVYSDWLEDYLCYDNAKWCEEAGDYLPLDDYNEIFQEWKKQNWCYDEVNDEYVYDAISVYVYDTEIGRWVCKDTNVDCRKEYTKINEDYYRTEQLTQYYDNYEVA